MGTISWSRAACIDLYYRSTASMTTVAHRYAWWSIVGLLSSSCCAVQVFFNTMALGSAGFNTVLGPIRPMTVASTTLLQLISWSVAYERPYPSTPTHAISTLLVVGLTFLPEFLFWYQTKRSTTTTSTNATHNSKEAAKTATSTTGTITTTLEYRLENVGCAACITTISNIVQHLACVHEFTISLEQLSVTTTIPTKKHDHKNNKNRNNIDNDEDATTNNHAALISTKLEEAGFPVQLLT